MKNRYIKIIIGLVIVFLLSLSLNRVINVKADSGWDTSYDSGSSHSSSYGSGSSYSSSYDSGTSYSSRSDWSRESGNRVVCTTKLCEFVPFFGGMVILLLVIIKFIEFVIFLKKNDELNSTYKRVYKELSIRDVNKVIPNFDIEKFKEKAYQIFYDVQMGWMEFDYDKLRELLSDELYNTYQMDLEILKARNRKNVMKKFKLIKNVLTELKEENNVYIAKIALEVKFIDYIEDSETHKALRGKTEDEVDNVYILTFEKTKDMDENICPRCGAKVEGNATGVCEQCNSKLVNKTHDWILVNKEKISQR